jgi:peptide/nickel transport system permease protein
MYSIAHKILKNKLALAALITLAALVFCAVFANLIAPDNSQDANTIELQNALLPPGTQVQYLEKTSEENFTFFSKWKGNSGIKNKVFYDSIHASGLMHRYYLQNRQMIQLEQQELAQYQSKTLTYRLGSDRMGRDVLSRVLMGSRVSLFIGMFAVAVSISVGVVLGSLAGYFRGKIDVVIMWLINVFWSIPSLLLVVAFTLALGKGLWQVFLAIGLSMWVDVARLVRGQVLSIREKEYIQAAQLAGIPAWRIIWKQILPNIVSLIMVIAASNFASAILIESGLSFLGLGVQPPTPSWGGIIRDHYAYLLMGKPWVVLAPAFAILLTVMSFMLLGNALRDVLDVRAKK